MNPRIREITDSFGGCIRISVEEHPQGALIVVERPDRPGHPRTMLDAYGVELLAGYVISARLAVPNDLPEEVADGSFAAKFQLHHDPVQAILISQPGSAISLDIPSSFWDRLYAELCLVVAHARELTRRLEMRVH